MDGRHTKSWAVIHCLSRYINRKLDWKWISWKVACNVRLTHCIARSFPHMLLVVFFLSWIFLIGKQWQPVSLLHFFFIQAGAFYVTTIMSPVPSVNVTVMYFICWLVNVVRPLGVEQFGLSYGKHISEQLLVSVDRDLWDYLTSYHFTEYFVHRD